MITVKAVKHFLKSPRISADGSLRRYEPPPEILMSKDQYIWDSHLFIWRQDTRKQPNALTPKDRAIEEKLKSMIEGKSDEEIIGGLQDDYLKGIKEEDDNYPEVKRRVLTAKEIEYIENERNIRTQVKSRRN